MWLSSIVSSCLFVMALSASTGNEYLPPSKGYNYDKPSIPFGTSQNGNRVPTPAPIRPVPTSRPTYIPPSTGPGPQPHDNGYDHSHNHDHGHEEHHDHGDHHHHEPGMPFDFSYQVAEDGNDYSHNAISDGDVTKGEYRVALPDGRTQIVKYTADWKNGFNAEVTYEGEAQYPEPPAGGYGSPSNNLISGSPNNGGGSSAPGYLPPKQGNGYQY